MCCSPGHFFPAFFPFLHTFGGFWMSLCLLTQLLPAPFSSPPLKLGSHFLKVSLKISCSWKPNDHNWDCWTWDHPRYFLFYLVQGSSIYQRLSFHTCFPLACRAGRKKKAPEYPLLPSLISVFQGLFHFFTNKCKRDGILWVFPLKQKRSC